MNTGLLELLRSDSSIVVNKALCHALGLKASVLLGEIVSRYFYFSDRGKLTEDGLFFNTIGDLQAGTSLTRYEQTSAIKTLEENGLIKTTRRGLPRKRYFELTVTDEKIAELLAKGKKIAHEAHKDYSMQKNHILDGKKTTCNKTTVLNNTKRTSSPEKSGPSDDSLYHLKPEEQKPEVRHYMETYENHFGKPHPRVRASQEERIYKQLEASPLTDNIYQAIDEHFQNLPEGNNGNILAFLDAVAYRPELLEQNKTDYQSIYDHYMTLGLRNHRAYTGGMRRAIEGAIKENKYDINYCMTLLDRHKQAIEATSKNEKPIQERGLTEFFGQKAYGGSDLICADYDEGGKYYEMYCKNQKPKGDGKPLKHIYVEMKSRGGDGKTVPGTVLERRCVIIDRDGKAVPGKPKLYEELMK